MEQCDKNIKPVLFFASCLVIYYYSVCMCVVYYRKQEVSSCQKQLLEFKAAAGVLMKWLEETKEQVPVLQPNCNEPGLRKELLKVNVSDGFHSSAFILLLHNLQPPMVQ